jgi:predicted DNA-binding protein YlxM (UPF0122 family)
MSEIIVKNNIEYKVLVSQPNYAVSKCARVIRVDTLKDKIPSLRGIPPYYTIRVCNDGIAKQVKLHRMVAEAWVLNDNPEEKIQVNHIDGDKFNNHQSNLEWVTPSRNQRHAIENNLKQKGEDLYNAELTEIQVHEICKHFVDGWIIKDISDKFNVSKDIIRKIKAGDTYFHVRQLYEIPHTYKNDFSESTVRWVCDKIIQTWSDKKISESSTNRNLTIIDVKRIRYKIRYKYISDEYF